MCQDQSSIVEIFCIISESDKKQNVPATQTFIGINSIHRLKYINLRIKHIKS